MGKIDRKFQRMQEQQSLKNYKHSLVKRGKKLDYVKGKQVIVDAPAPYREDMVK